MTGDVTILDPVHPGYRCGVTSREDGHLNGCSNSPRWSVEIGGGGVYACDDCLPAARDRLRRREAA